MRTSIPNFVVAPQSILFMVKNVSFYGIPLIHITTLCASLKLNQYYNDWQLNCVQKKKQMSCRIK